MLARDKTNLFVFSEDGAFYNPSAGAAVVNPGNMNGRTNGQTEAGETYREWHEKRLAAVEEMSKAAD